MVRTRFAPSPTGYMHIGGMRTALFNWLWARHNGGQFILRIDDTDEQRNVDAALQPILEAFRWLGLNWDEGPEVGGPFEPYFQSQRQPRYAEVCRELLERDLAYHDFDPAEAVQADREAAEKEKRPFLNVRRSLDLSRAERFARAERGEPHVVRFLVDRQSKASIDDIVRGHVEWDCGLMPDPVILRGNGMPLYNFASVVDDIDLKITDVIRAEEHLSNTPVQALLFQALGAPLPKFAHIPFVAAPGTKEKLSKREKKLEKYRTSPQFKKLFQLADEVLPQLGLTGTETLNPVMVAFYQMVGFLPEAVLNALSRLGWSYDDKTEYMSLDFIVQNFTLDRVVKAPAGLDPDKLMACQEYWMVQKSLEEKVAACRPYVMQQGWTTESLVDERLPKVIALIGDRLKLFSDILAYSEFFVPDDQLTLDEKGFEKRLLQAPHSVKLLTAYAERLAGANDFTATALEASFNEFLTQQGAKHGDVIHALRLAITGKTAGAGMFETLALLGKNACLRRIEATLKRA